MQAQGDRTNDPPSTTSALDAEALARGLASEAGRSYTLDERRAVAWAIRNASARRDRSIADLGGGGDWGPQGEKAANGLVRSYSTAQAASASDRELAAQVLSEPPSMDPTGGATAFFEPAVQDIAAARGTAYREDPASHPDWERFRRYYSDSLELRERWSARGQVYLATVGRWEFWS